MDGAVIDFKPVDLSQVKDRFQTPLDLIATKLKEGESLTRQEALIVIGSLESLTKFNCAQDLFVMYDQLLSWEKTYARVGKKYGLSVSTLRRIRAAYKN